MSAGGSRSGGGAKSPADRAKYARAGLACRVGRMTNAFKVLTSLLFVAVVVQVALAGYGAFYAVDKSDDNGSISKHGVEHGFNAHAALRTIILVLMLLLVIVASPARLGTLCVHAS